MAHKKPIQETGLATREPAVIVMSETGLAHRSSVDRLKGRIGSIPDPRQLSVYEKFWGRELFTSDQVRRMFVDAIGEGFSPNEALERLKNAHGGRMPTAITFKKWEDQFPDFKREMSYAKAVRGDLMADAATEMALDMDPEAAQSNKVAIQHLQWQASKLNREAYGEQKSMTIDVNANLHTSDEKDLDRRILEMLRDPELRRALAADPDLEREVKTIEGEVVKID
jgi:hypothetical protein